MRRSFQTLRDNGGIQMSEYYTATAAVKNRMSPAQAETVEHLRELLARQIGKATRLAEGESASLEEALRESRAGRRGAEVRQRIERALRLTHGLRRYIRILEGLAQYVEVPKRQHGSAGPHEGHADEFSDLGQDILAKLREVDQLVAAARGQLWWIEYRREAEWTDLFTWLAREDLGTFDRELRQLYWEY
jgi:hypothetical protein